MSGLAVFGAGLGSFAWTLVGRALMNPTGFWALLPHQAMQVMAVLFFMLLLLSLPFLRNPPPGYSGNISETYPVSHSDNGGALQSQGSLSKPSCLSPGPPFSLQPDREYTFLSSLQTSEMRLTLFIVFCTSLPGVVFLSSAADMASNIFGLDSQDSSLVTAWLNLSNFSGRFFWGFITDKIGRKSFWILTASLQMLALLVMRQSLALGGEEGRVLWMVTFLGIGSLYGGGFGVLPAFLSDMFGARISSATHGAAIFFWSLACVLGAPLFAAVNTAYAEVRVGQAAVPTRMGYAVNALWLSFFPMVALISVIFLNVRKEDRRVARVTDTWRGRLGAWLCVIKCSTFPCYFRLLDSESQEKEYSIHKVREGIGEGVRGERGGVVGEDFSPPRKDDLAGTTEVLKHWDDRLRAWDEGSIWGREG